MAQSIVKITLRVDHSAQGLILIPTNFLDLSGFFMCLILFSYDPGTSRPLTVLANRDEFYDRATDQADFWSDKPGILAGRDLVAGGTWLGVNTKGRFAAVTNYRDLSNINLNARSRGELTTEFLSGNESADDYLSRIETRGGDYNGFNLLVFDSNNLAYYSNMSEAPPSVLNPGIYGLSNHLLDTPWPKVVSGKEAMKVELESGPGDDDSLLSVLADTTVAADPDLPDTGVGIERERALSARCIVSPGYGTRCSTLVSFAADGRIKLKERTIVPPDLLPHTVSFEIETA